MIHLYMVFLTSFIYQNPHRQLDVLLKCFFFSSIHCLPRCQGVLLLFDFPEAQRKTCFINFLLMTVNLTIYKIQIAVSVALRFFFFCSCYCCQTNKIQHIYQGILMQKTHKGLHRSGGVSSLVWCVVLGCRRAEASPWLPP